MREATGRLVVVTGIDGCGKTTQVERLATWLEANGHPVASGGWRMKEVEGQFIGDLVQRISKADLALPPETTVLLFAANLSYRVTSKVRPALEEGRTFVEDDFAYKMMARAHAYGLPSPWIESVFRFMPEPDVTVLLDVSPEGALARIGDRITLYEAGLDAEDRRGGFLRHQAQVRDHLLRMAERDRWIVLKGDGRSENELAKEICTRVVARLGGTR